MTPETEVIACPACKHLVRVPQDWLGTQVQCPECKAMFRAPMRAGDALGEPELLARAEETVPAPRSRMDPMLLIPAFGLMITGLAGTLVNGFMLYMMLSEPGGAKGWAKNQIPALRQAGFGTPGTPEEQAAEDERLATDLARAYQWIIPTALTVSALVLLGGLSIVLRRNYRYAQLSCVLAALNIAHGCCVPGAVFGVWGLLMLFSDEGREHFVR